MIPLYAALAAGAVLIGVDAWLRWKDNEAAAFAEITEDEDDDE